MKKKKTSIKACQGRAHHKITEPKSSEKLDVHKELLQCIIYRHYYTYLGNVDERTGCCLSVSNCEELCRLSASLALLLRKSCCRKERGHSSCSWQEERSSSPNRLFKAAYWDILILPRTVPDKTIGFVLSLQLPWIGLHFVWTSWTAVLFILQLLCWNPPVMLFKGYELTAVCCQVSVRAGMPCCSSKS